MLKRMGKTTLTILRSKIITETGDFYEANGGRHFKYMIYFIKVQ